MLTRTDPAWRTTSNPATLTRPAAGAMTVVRQLISVVLPAPLGPSIPTRLPFSTAKETSLRAFVAPNDLLRSSSSTMAVMAPDLLVFSCICQQYLGSALLGGSGCGPEARTADRTG